jgi:hypothetical protein
MGYVEYLVGGCDEGPNVCVRNNRGFFRVYLETFNTLGVFA